MHYRVMKKLLESVEDLDAAKNPETKPEHLAKLIDHADPNISKEAAANPNLPPPSFSTALQKHPKETINNPAFTLMQLEDPHFSFIPERHKNNLAAAIEKYGSQELIDSTIPTLINNFLANGSSAIIPQHIKDNYHNLTFKSKYELLRDGMTGKNKNTHPDIINALMADDEKYTSGMLKGMIASHPNTPHQILAKLAGDNIPEINRSLALNSNTPLDILNNLLTKDSETKQNVLKNKSLPLEVLEKFAKHPHAEYRMSVATNTSLPPDLLHQLAQDHDFDVRELVSRNQNTHPDTLKMLVKESPSAIHDNILYHPKADPETKKIAAQKSSLRSR